MKIHATPHTNYFSLEDDKIRSAHHWADKRGMKFWFGFHLTTVSWVVVFLSDMSNVFSSAEDLAYVCNIHEVQYFKN